NPMNFPPRRQGEPCNSNWRVMTGACWRSSFPAIPSHGLASDGGKNKGDHVLATAGKLWPCDYNLCCLKYFRVCIIDGVRTVTELGGEPGECKENPNPLENCTPVCD
ncbi:MAG TPA: hypothetical protein VEC36_08750, partial [Patescibacteria group bacterium]|nr:hypothetical protein [Patescibacteria group bacterium]